jgi:hypothetical protein
MRAIPVAAFIIALFNFGFSATIHIPADQPTIQSGIDIAETGDTILVAPDTYHENIALQGSNIILASEYLLSWDSSLIGQTISDGDSSGSVLTINMGEDGSTHIIGFTLTNGSGSQWESYGNSGGGIYCQGSSPVISDCKIIANTAEYGAGILCVDNSSPQIKNCLIRNNNAEVNGGGILARFECNLIIDSCIIDSNSAPAGGGSWLRD